MSEALQERFKDSVVLMEAGATIADGQVQNTSGIVPFDHRLLILHDETKKQTAGGVWLPEQEVDKQKYAQTKATVIALGHMCWAEAKYDAQQWGVNATFPEVGDRVLVGRYTGDTHKGVDEKEYTIINDSDVIAFLS